MRGYCRERLLWVELDSRFSCEESYTEKFCTLNAFKSHLPGTSSRRFTHSIQSTSTVSRVILKALLFLCALGLVSPQLHAQGSCSNGSSTQITGTVYAPNGTDPLPNILVYVPATTLNAFTDGVSTTNPVVDNAANLVSGSPIVQTTTGANGQF